MPPKRPPTPRGSSEARCATPIKGSLPVSFLTPRPQSSTPAASFYGFAPPPPKEWILVGLFFHAGNLTSFYRVEYVKTQIPLLATGSFL